MGETAGIHFDCTKDVPGRWVIGGTNVCKSLHVWQAHSIPPGTAIPELENKTLNLFNINKMLPSRKMTVRVALAHRLLLVPADKHGNYTAEVRQFGGFGCSATPPERWLALWRQTVDQPSPIKQNVIPRPDILPGMRGPERLPSIRVRTHGNCVAGSSGKTL
jgi:hypothetical protein